MSAKPARRPGATASYVFGAVFAIAGVVAGLFWFGTMGAARACTLTGQLAGQTCYPAGSDAHAVAGPLALVCLAIAALHFILSATRR
jgi:hypothetical protein